MEEHAGDQLGTGMLCSSAWDGDDPHLLGTLLEAIPRADPYPHHFILSP